MTFTKTATLIAAAFPAMFASVAWAEGDGSAGLYQRDVDQQRSIRQGLRDGHPGGQWNQHGNHGQPQNWHHTGHGQDRKSVV